MKSLLLALLAVVSAAAYSQPSYNTVVDNASFDGLKIGAVGLAEFHLNGEGLFYVRLNADYRTPIDGLSLHAAHCLAVSESRKSALASTFLTSDNEYQGQNITEVGLNFDFRDKTAVRDIKVKLASGRSGSTTINYVSYLPANVRTTIGGRVGLYRYANALDLTDVDGETLTIDSYTLPGVSIITGADRDPKAVSFGQRIAATYIGLSYGRNSGLIVDTDEYGRRGLKKKMEVYADLLIGVAADVESIYIDGRVLQTRELPDDAQYKSIGWRLGVESSNYSLKGHGLSLGLEVGTRPSHFEPKLHVMLGVGYQFATTL